MEENLCFENICFENIGSDISVKIELNENTCKENIDVPNNREEYKGFSMCGEVLKSHIKKEFLLICSYCKAVTNNLEEFETHLQETHCEFNSWGTLGETEISDPENAESLAESNTYCGRNVIYLNEIEENIYLNEKEENIFIGYENNEKYGDKTPISNDETVSLVSDSSEITELIQINTSISPEKNTENLAQPQKDTFDYAKIHEESTSKDIKESTENKRPCKYCGKIYKNQRYLLKHEQYHEKGGKHKCNFPGCEKGFFRRQRMEEHMVAAHGIGEKKYKCTYCGHAFAHKQNLNVHIKQLHTHEKNYSCVTCGKRFVTTTELKKHMLTHTGETPHQCEICGQKYRYQSTFKAHMRKHADERIYKCKQCPKAFFSWSALDRHKTTHSNVKPHQCTTCSRSFGRKYHLKLHELVHLTIKKYVCNICNKSYSQSSGLNTHRKSHGHPIAQFIGKSLTEI